MTPGELFGVTSGALGALVSLGTLAKHVMTHGADRQRLKANEDWIRDHSVERSDFTNLIRRVDEAERDCVPRREFDHLSHRMDKAEGELTEVARVLTDIRVAQERISTKLDAQNELVDTKLETISHRMRNIQQGIEGLARQNPSFSPSGGPS